VDELVFSLVILSMMTDIRSSAIIFDRVASIGGWMHAIDERDLGTEFPLRSADFESDVRNLGAVDNLTR